LYFVAQRCALLIEILAPKSFRQLFQHERDQLDIFARSSTPRPGFR